MAKTNAIQSNAEHDVIIIGAGVCGIYLVYRMLELGLKVTVLEAGDGPGGTWYWNRYPGARFDSESYTYGYSFSKELLQDWDWSEHFAAQPETLRYLNHVIDRFDLREHMQFGCEVKSAAFDDAANGWKVQLQDGRTFTTRLLFTAMGMLSAHTMPRIEGVDRFKGHSFHTYNWPREGISLADKRVAVIGTGATGVQVISEIADKVGELKVFQRRPNWCAPLHNAPITEAEQAQIKASYDDIFARCLKTPGGFLHGPDRRSYMDVTEAEKLEFWELLYASPGFGVWLGNFREVLMDADINREFSEFIANKIRARVNDPAVAEKLIPKDHGFGSRRVPMETFYYEAYNLPNVELVDLNEAPIERITEDGLQTSAKEYSFDIIVYATGFHAITGAFDRVQFEGTDGQTLKDKWEDGPITYLGLQSAGFPNLVTLAGPQSGSVSTNFPRGIEEAVDWTTGLVKFMREQGYQRVEANKAAEDEWTEHVKSLYEFGLATTTKSWFTGYNSNVDGHEDKLRHLVYFGGAPKYRERLAEIADNNYDGFEFG